jgi:hypothetical protein
LGRVWGSRGWGTGNRQSIPWREEEGGGAKTSWLHASLSNQSSLQKSFKDVIIKIVVKSQTRQIVPETLLGASCLMKGSV